MTTRRTMLGSAFSASGIVGRLRVHEIAADFQTATPKLRFYPNGYSSLTQRLVSSSGNYSDQSNNDKYFCTIHETEHLARSLHAGDY